MAEEVPEINRSMVERILAMPVDEPAEDGYALRVLQTRGRRSGELRRTPIAVVRHGGNDYVVSPETGRDWVRNMIAEPMVEILTGDGVRPVAALRVDADAGAPVVGAYLAAMNVPWALAAFPVGPDAPTSTIRAHMGSIAVFRLDDRSPAAR